MNGARTNIENISIASSLATGLKLITDEHRKAVINGFKWQFDGQTRREIAVEMKEEALKFASVMKLMLNNGLIITPNDDGHIIQEGSWAKFLLSLICSGWDTFDFKNTGLVELLIKTNKGKAIFTEEDMKLFKKEAYLETTTNPTWRCEKKMYMAFGKK